MDEEQIVDQHEELDTDTRKDYDYASHSLIALVAVVMLVAFGGGYYMGTTAHATPDLAQTQLELRIQNQRDLLAAQKDQHEFQIKIIKNISDICLSKGMVPIIGLNGNVDCKLPR